MLDNLFAEKHIWQDWVKHHFLEVGYLVDEAFSVIAEWAEKRDTEAAINVAGQLFFNEAYRVHLPLFDRLVSGKEKLSMLQSHVRFGVKYRSLL